MLKTSNEIPSRVLLVDDERNILRSLSRILVRKGLNVETAESGEEALLKTPAVVGREWEESPHDVVVLDLKMPGMDGLKLLPLIRERIPDIQVIVLTGYGTIRSAVEATRAGAMDYLVKPCCPDELVALIDRAARKFRAIREQRNGGSPAQGDPRRVPQIIGQSEALLGLVRLADRVARTSSSVLLCGESGTGKELLARLLHDRSRRSKGPFVPVNCATVTPSLAESFFFGHRKGAFTGADADSKGFFQAAHEGTLFLDEVGDFPLAAQGVLLRALQEGKITPLGTTRLLPVDVRVISATNRDLDAEVKTGQFRADLFYRLDVVRMQVPPLRDRPEDIPPLIEKFVGEFKSRFGFGPSHVTDAALGRLVQHRWPGNVRELRNVIERAFVVAEEDTLDLLHLPVYLQDDADGDIPNLTPLEVMERRQILAALKTAAGQKKAAAELLGIDRKRLYRRLKRLGLSV